MKTKKLKHPYGYVANSIINDKNLSFNAKGVYLYILSKPDGWDFSQKRIAESSKTSEYSVRAAIAELEKNKLLERTKLGNGRVVYSIKDPAQECIFQKTNTACGKKSQKTNTQHANTHVANTGGISNKEIKVIKNNTSNKENTHSLSYLKNVSNEDAKIFSADYKCYPQDVYDMAEEIVLYCESKGKKYSNYRSTLQQWLRRKYGKRPEVDYAKI